MSQKGIAPILVILLIAAAIGGYLIYSGKINLNQTKTEQTQTFIADETVNWETYVNTAHSYKIQYPSEVTLQSETPDNSEVTYALEMMKDIGKPSYKIARIRILEPEIERDPKLFPGQKPISTMSNLSLKDFVERLWGLNKEESSDKAGVEIGSIAQTNIDGNEAYQFTLTRSYNHSTGGGEVLDEKNLLIFTERDGKIYNLIVPTNETILNKVISTFKFTN